MDFSGYMSINAGDREELEEERRLCYVGITRAEQELTLTSARRRMVHGETQYNPMSRFVKEIPRELLDTGNKKFTQETEMPAQQNTYARAREAFRAQAFGGAFGGMAPAKNQERVRQLQEVRHWHPCRREVSWQQVGMVRLVMRSETGYVM